MTTGVLSAPPVKASQTQTLLEHRLEAYELYSSLSLDARLVTSEATTRVELSPEDREKLRAAPTGLQAVTIGVNKPTSILVSFGQGSLSMLSQAPRSMSGGMLRQAETGRAVWTTAIEAPDAGGIRLRFTDFKLSPNMELVLYNLEGEAVGPYRGTGPLKEGEFWSHTVSGSTVYLELRSIGFVTEADLTNTSFIISEIAYLDADLYGQFVPMLFPNASCVQDANCWTLPAVQVNGTTYTLDEVLGGAVALMLFDVDDVQKICTVGLVNADSSEIPYFLTANHCLDNQASANSLETIWQYKTASCAGAYPPRSAFPSLLGSTLLATSTQSDFTFLRLPGLPPGDVFFLGWTSANHATSGGTSIYRVSHPLASPQMVSVHSISAVPNPGSCVGLPHGDFIYSKDDLGSTEGGSSGSPVTLANSQIVGQLLGACGSNPNNVCDAVGNSTVDGSFATTFPDIQSWLLPVPAPPTDNFAQRQSLSGFSVTVAGSNNSATKQTGEPDHAGRTGGTSVWYQWTSPETGRVTIDTRGSNFDTLLGVYTGSELSMLTQVAGNDDFGPNFSSLVTFHGTAGVTYLISVDGYLGASGEYVLHVNRAETSGYAMLGADGGIFNFGSSQFLGSLPAMGFIPVAALQVIKNTASENGYYMMGLDGGTFAFGDAPFLGSLPGLGIVNQTIDMEPTASGNGYYLLGVDGGVFAFGDAGFHGSLPALGIVNQALDLEVTPSGQGYWVLGADGGIFAFGDAQFFGSLPQLGIIPNKPLKKIKATPSGNGYYLLGEDGGLFGFGGAAFLGSLPGEGINATATDLEIDPAGRGYYILVDDGTVYNFGAAPNFGNLPEYGVQNSILDMDLNIK